MPASVSAMRSQTGGSDAQGGPLLVWLRGSPLTWSPHYLIPYVIYSITQLCSVYICLHSFCSTECHSLDLDGYRKKSYFCFVLWEHIYILSFPEEEFLPLLSSSLCHVYFTFPSLILSPKLVIHFTKKKYVM